MGVCLAVHLLRALPPSPLSLSSTLPVSLFLYLLLTPSLSLSRLQLLIVAAINKADAEKARGARHYLHLGRKDIQKRHEIRHTTRGQRGKKRKKGHSGATYAGLMKADADKTPLDLQIATGNGVNSKKSEQGRKGR